jgi:hypothetical protein
MSRTKTIPPPHQAWTEHEHVAPPVELEARKLLSAAGTPEVAKQALEAVAESRTHENHKTEDLALALGFRSYRALLEGSTKGANIAGYQWFVTAIRGDEWVLWNDRDLEILGVFETQADALSAAR